jgi:hypothetical protein
MQKTSFWKAGHTPSLIAAFLYFDMSFMVWVMLGPLGVQIAQDLGLTAAQKGLMVATPVLAGALLRMVWGMMVDHLKPKLAGTIGQVIVIVALLAAWKFGIHTYEQTLIPVCSSVLPVRRLRWHCRWPRAGIRPSTRALRLVSPAPATRGRHLPPCSAPVWQSHSVGKMYSALPPFH